MRAHAERGGTATLHETQGIKREEDRVGIRGGRCTATQVEMVATGMEEQDASRISWISRLWQLSNHLEHCVLCVGLAGALIDVY